jgi:hypothetical protein
VQKAPHGTSKGIGEEFLSWEGTGSRKEKEASRGSRTVPKANRYLVLEQKSRMENHAARERLGVIKQNYESLKAHYRTLLEERNIYQELFPALK